MRYDVKIESSQGNVECRHECSGDETEALRQVRDKYSITDAKTQSAVARPDLEGVEDSDLEPLVEEPPAAAPEVITANDDYIARVIDTPVTEPEVDSNELVTNDVEPPASDEDTKEFTPIAPEQPASQPTPEVAPAPETVTEQPAAIPVSQPESPVVPEPKAEDASSSAGATEPA